MRNRLFAVIDTLGQIEIKGRDNMNYLLGCIQELERIIDELNKIEEEKDQERRKLGKKSKELGEDSVTEE